MRHVTHCNECIAPGPDFVFHCKDVLALAALLSLGFADVVLEALHVFHAQGHAGMGLRPLSLVYFNACSAEAMRSSAQASRLPRSC